MPCRQRHCLSVAILLYTMISTFLWHNLASHNRSEPKSRKHSSWITSSSLPLLRPEHVCDTSDEVLYNNIQRKWDTLDKTIQQNYSKIRVSRGIFLYPRQTAILSYLICRIQQEIGSLPPFHNKNATMPDITVCETGFGSGHSMALLQLLHLQSLERRQRSNRENHIF
jgi:hypothetical protein